MLSISPTDRLFVLAGAGVRPLQFSRRKGTAAIFQLIGAACLIVVIIAHLCEALNWFPWMHWGHEHSVGHYVDLVAAIGGLSLFPLGYLLGALTREVA